MGLRSPHNSTYDTIWRSFSLIERGDRWLVTLSVCLALVIAFIEVIITGLIASLSGLLSFRGEISEIHLDTIAYLSPLNTIMSRLFENSAYPLLLSCLTLIILALSARALLMLSYTWHSASLAEQVSGRCRARMIRLYQGAPILWLKQQAFADQQYNVGVTSVISSFISHSLNIMTSALMLIVLMLGFALISPSLSLALIIVIGVIGMSLMRLIRRVLKRQSEAVLIDELQLSSLSYLALHGLQELRLYLRSDAVYDRILSVLDRFRKGRARQQTLSLLPTITLELLGFIILFFITVGMNDEQGMSLTMLSTQLGLFAATAWRALPIFNRLLSGISALEVTRPHLDRILNLFDQEWDGSEEMTATVSTEGQTFSLNIKRLVVDNLSFQYPHIGPEDRGEPESIINALSFALDEGESLAIMGSSGVGKSTLTQLLSGLLIADEGLISLGEYKLSRQCLREWRQRVSYVSQSPYLFDMSLADNITLAGWSDEPLGAEVQSMLQESCQLAQVDFIDDLAEGMDTLMGDEGVRLSGGQAQRIAIARALFHQPTLLILDESMNALDEWTEGRLIDGLFKCLKNPHTNLKFIILVTHKESLALRCDRHLRLKREGDR